MAGSMASAISAMSAMHAMGGQPMGPGAMAPQGLCSVHGKNRSLEALTADGHGGMMCTQEKQCKVAGAGTKHIPCTFWQVGKCTKGDSCNFAHVPDTGAMDGGFSGGFDGGKGKGWGGAGGGCFPMEKGMDKGGCKGAMMAWMQKGMMAMMSKGMDKGFDKGMDKGMGKKGKGKGYSQPIGGTVLCSVHNKQRSANAVMDAGNGTYQCRPDSECKGGNKVKAAMCSFFLEGRCTKGESCSFAHSQEEIGQPVSDGGPRFVPY